MFRPKWPSSSVKVLVLGKLWCSLVLTGSYSCMVYSSVRGHSFCAVRTNEHYSFPKTRILTPDDSHTAKNM
jgi:hypothetical protein